MRGDHGPTSYSDPLWRNMNRGKRTGGFESLIHKSKDLFANRMSAFPNGTVMSAARFKGKLGAAIAVITSLIVGFLTIPNNILYFIDNKHRTKLQPYPSGDGRPEYENAYIHAGIALITLGCLAMVVSIVLSYFAAKSRRKMYHSEGTRTVLVCLVMMNIELFMSVIAGCMEMLYQPLIRDTQRLHNMECAIAVFNIIIYIMYVVTMVMTSTVLKEKQESIPVDALYREVPEAMINPREYARSSMNSYNSQSNNFL